MMSFKKADLPANNTINYVSLSRWDNTAGPLTKCVWMQPSTTPDEADVRHLTRLVLKTEVTRNPSLSDIDCSVYALPEMSVCAVSYIFGAACNARLCQTIYCITFVYKLCESYKYLQWCDILDTTIKHDIVKYKVLLHSDFEARDVTRSNKHLYRMIDGSVGLLDRLDKTVLDFSTLRVEDTYFRDVEDKSKAFLERIANCMMLSFGRVIVVGKEHYRSKVDKWVKTLSFLLADRDRDKCFSCSFHNDVFIPNAMVQGVLLTDDLKSRRDCLLTLYTMCDYPVTIVECKSRSVYCTASYQLHLSNQVLIRERQLLQLRGADLDILDKALDDTKEDFRMGIEVSPLIADMFKQMYSIGAQGRLDYVDQYMYSLRSKATALAEYIIPKSRKLDASNRLMRSELMRYVMRNRVDLEVILCLSEVLQPGIYSYVADETSDSKSIKVNEIL